MMALLNFIRLFTVFLYLSGKLLFRMASNLLLLLLDPLVRALDEPWWKGFIFQIIGDGVSLHLDVLDQQEPVLLIDPDRSHFASNICFRFHRNVLYPSVFLVRVTGMF